MPRSWDSVAPKSFKHSKKNFDWDDNEIKRSVESQNNFGLKIFMPGVDLSVNYEH